MGTSITNSQQLPCTVEITDSKGQPAKVQDPPEWRVSDETIAVVEAAADGMSATVKATGLLGGVNVTVHADADLGEGVKTIIGLLELTVTQGQAAIITITAGSPEEIPSAGPK